MINKKSKKTAVQLSEETRDVLKEMGSKGDTYDDVICSLISHRDPELGKKCGCYPAEPNKTSQ